MGNVAKTDPILRNLDLFFTHLPDGARTLVISSAAGEVSSSRELQVPEGELARVMTSGSGGSS